MRDNKVFILERLGWRDLSVLRRYYAHPRQLYREWLTVELAPCFSHRFIFLSMLAHRWVAPVNRLDTRWRRLDPWGWQQHPFLQVHDPNLFKLRTQGAQKMFTDLLTAFHVSDREDRALHELLATCQREHLPAALVYLPESTPLRAWYPPATDAADQGYFARLGQEFHVPFINARDWIADEGFGDVVHLVPAGAAQFTDRFVREALVPLLDGAQARVASAP